MTDAGHARRVREGLRRGAAGWLLLSAAWLVLPVVATAGVVQAPSVLLELRTHDYDARESTGGGFELNREQGKLDGLAVGFSLHGPAGQWSLLARQDKGRIAYRGVNQLMLPVVTRTHLKVQVLELQWTPDWRARLGPIDLGGALELAQQRIDRAIQPSPSSQALSEVLEITWIRAAVVAEWPFHPTLSLKVRESLAWPLRQELGVETFGAFDPFSLRPRARASHGAHAGIEWRPIEGLRAGLWVEGERWRFGRAPARTVYRDGEAAGSASYPGSRQKLEGARLRMEYSLPASR